MTKEQLLKRYKICRHNQRAGSTYFSVRKRRRIGWWYTAFKVVQCGLTDCYREKLYWLTYEDALDWVDDDVDTILTHYNNEVVTIDKFEPLIKENNYLIELTNLLDQI